MAVGRHGNGNFNPQAPFLRTSSPLTSLDAVQSKPMRIKSNDNELRIQRSILLSKTCDYQRIYREDR